MVNEFHISSALIDHELMGFVTVFIIISQIDKKNYIINLDNKLLDFIGKISFGIYVYHPLIIFISTIFLLQYVNDKSLLSYIIVFGFNVIITVVISYVSYKYFENPFIKMKDKYQTVKSKA
jgi:peptidoglycan/LPS O-acetylase OafA/YrhL